MYSPIMKWDALLVFPGSKGFAGVTSKVNSTESKFDERARVAVKLIMGSSAIFLRVIWISGSGVGIVPCQGVVEKETISISGCAIEPGG